MIEKVRQYAQSFEYTHLHSVYQFIKRFKWSYDGERLMRQLIDEIDTEMRKVAERRAAFRKETRKKEGLSPVTQESETEVEKIREPETIPTVVGFCPKCGSYLRGMPTPACSKVKNGRHFYKECEACSYIAEVWKRGNKFIETEGG